MGTAYLTPTEVTPGSASAWVDVDVSASVPAGATGVLLHVVNTAAAPHAFGLRKNGSTDNDTRSLHLSHHLWAVVGLDASRLFEAYVGSTSSIDLYLIGYFDAGATFFTNRVDKSTSTTGSWVDVDISGDTGGATAIAACIEISEAQDHNWGVRKNGSTDARLQDDGEDTWQHIWAIIGVDGSEIFEQHIAATTVDLFLIGYLTSGATLYTNALERSLGSTGSWQDLTALPAGAVGGIYEGGLTSGVESGLRVNGASESILREWKHAWAFPQCDASRLVEMQVADLSVDCFELGYFTTTSSLTLTVSVTETVLLTESRPVAIPLLVRPTELVSLTEFAGLANLVGLTVLDAVALEETVSVRLNALVLALTETVQVSEQLGFSSAPPQWLLSATETVSLSESVTVSGPLYLSTAPAVQQALTSAYSGREARQSAYHTRDTRTGN